MYHGPEVITKESLMAFTPVLSLGLNSITRNINDNFKEKMKKRGMAGGCLFFQSIKNNCFMVLPCTCTHTQLDIFIFFFILNGSEP